MNSHLSHDETQQDQDVTIDGVEQAFNPAEWITTREAAELAGYTKKGIIEAARKGYINFIKMGNLMLYKRKNVLAYIDKMKSLGNQRFTPHIHLNQEVVDERKSVI